MTKEILLTQGKVAIVDDGDFEELNKHKWWTNRYGNRWYAGRIEYQNGKAITFLMHRYIMNAPKGMEVDHKNDDGLDNTRENLRLATSSQNKCNISKRVTNKGAFKGVYWYVNRQKWQVYIQVNGKTVYIGSFNTAEEGARAYDKAAVQYHGEFARLNFPG